MGPGDKVIKKVYEEAVAKTEKEYIAFRTLQELVSIPSESLIKRAKRAQFKVFVGEYPGMGPRTSMLRREDAVAFVAHLANPRTSAKSF